MVLKFEQDTNEIFFLEANATEGVTITRWSHFREYAERLYES